MSMDPNKWINTLPNINNGSDQGEYKLDSNIWVNTIPKKNIAQNFNSGVKMPLFTLFDQEHFYRLKIIATGYTGNINTTGIISPIPFHAVFPVG